MPNKSYIDFVEDYVSKSVLVEEEDGRLSGKRQNFKSNDERFNKIYNEFPMIVETLTGKKLERNGKIPNFGF